MSQTIVVALDGSPLAEHALPYATALARALEARVILLHARWTAVFPEADAPDLDAIARRLRADRVEVATHICHMPCVEDAGPAILDAAAELGAGLIVMATHGRGGLGRLLYGSVADQVLRHTTLPVLLIPPHCEGVWPADRPLRVLATLDGSEHGEAILAPLLDLLGPVGADLLLLRVLESIDYVKPHGDDCAVCRAARAKGEEPDIEPVRARRYVDGVAARLRTAGATVEARMEIGQSTSTILRIAGDANIDLIAMATHGRGGLARVVMGSVATATLRQTRVPVLLTRPASVRRAEPAAERDARRPGKRRAPILARDIMTQPLVTVGEDTSLEEIARLMLERGIGGVPVVDAAGYLQGIVTESDFCGREHAVPFSIYRMPQAFGQWLPREGIEAIYQAARTLRARDVMRRPVATATDDEPVAELVRRMIERGLRRLPVIRDAVPVGIVTRHDLLRLMARDTSESCRIASQPGQTRR